MTRFRTAIAVSLATFASAATAWEPEQPAAPSPENRLSVQSTELRIARSKDGLHFVATGEVFLRHGGSPDLVVSRTGDVLAIFDFADPVENGKQSRLAVARSRNGGLTWSRAAAIQFTPPIVADLHPRKASFVKTPGGGLRLYFLAEGQPWRSAARRRKDVRSQNPDGVSVLSATSTDGRSFRLDRRIHIPTNGLGFQTLTAARFGHRLHLYLGGLDELDYSTTSHHWVSRRGTRFISIRASQTPPVSFSGSIVEIREGRRQLRAYVSTGRRVISMVSRDGRDWSKEPGIRLDGGWDPAVTRLRDGSYLMIYCAPLAAADNETELVEVSPDADEIDDFWNAPDIGELAGELDIEESELADGDTVLDEYAADGSPDDEAMGADLMVNDTDPRLAENGLESENSDTLPLNETDGTDVPSNDPGYEIEGKPGYAEDEPALDWRETWDPEETDGFPPVPDFKNWIDYVGWYKEYEAVVPGVNAFDVYMEFMPDPEYDLAGDAEWPLFNDMFNKKGDFGIGPWDPADHPEWEESDRSNRGLFDRFTDAAKIEHYKLPAEFPEDVLDRRPGEEFLLLEMRLPHLGKHRSLIKATLAGAWRKGDDGKVSPQRMRETFETALRAASHMQHGYTIIEDLVGVAERALVHKNALEALRQGIFSDGELEGVLNTLRDFDLRDADPGRHLRSEQAFSMQTTQYLFPPHGPGGEPQLDIERARAVVGEMFGEEVGFDGIQKMTADDARLSVKTLDTLYHELADKMRIGYPEVRVGDINALHEKYVHTTPLTEALMPNLSRYYQLRAREEASSRATQLAYATHLFKAKHGRFPESLDELPADIGRAGRRSGRTDMRIDPFTGDYFGYRLTDDGPMIYSASENGRDDGGVHAARWNDKVESDEDSDDYVFYPPQP